MHRITLGSAMAILAGLYPATIAALPVDVIGEFEPIVVTATRTAKTADETLASVTVITRADIEREQARSFGDLLRGVPGIGISNNGGLGKATSLFLRGTESDHILVLIDGVKVGSATLGTAPFQHIPLDQIERIEIVRGPRSSLYGSEAIGGVIQIFTRKGGGELKPTFRIGGGSYASYDGFLGISGGGERAWFNLSVGGEGTEGFDACEGNLSAGCYADDSDDDGYRNLSGSLRGGYRFSDSLELDLHTLYVQTDTRYDGGFSDKTESIQQITGMIVRLVPIEEWRMTLSGGSSRDDSQNYKGGSYASRFTTLRDSFSLQNDFKIGKEQLLSLGGDYWNDRVGGTTDYEVTSRDSKGVFIQYQGRFGSNNLQFSLREDDNEQFGNKTTGDVAWGYNFRNGVRLTTSYGTAFKAPTFNELYFPGYGNSDLRPEESISYELGLDGDASWGWWKLSLYETVIDQLIAFDTTTFAPGNVDEARIRGLEGETNFRLGEWRVAGAFTLLDTENRSKGDNEGNTLPRRAGQTLRIDADRAWGKIQFGATLLAVGKRYDDLANKRELEAFNTLDLRVEYTLEKAWLIQVRVENLLDEEYQTAAFYNQPGRGAYLTLRYSP